MKRFHLTKIVSTLGPASNTAEKIKALALAGVNVFRLNFSHGSHEDHRQNVGYIRAVEKELGRPLAILADMQGPKLRIGNFKNGFVELRSGDKFRLDMSPEAGSEKRVCLPHPEIFRAMTAETELLLNDGLVRLRVDDFGKDYADTTVITGGRLSDKKGLNVPGVPLPIAALTEKDKADLRAALDMGVDFIGLSFVQRPEDVLFARSLIDGKAAIISKIEKPSALKYLEEIIGLSDGIMVARGDLGVEVPPEKVPVLQKKIIRACRQNGKPVIVATQMLESMVSNPTPTRAEASDVATAVFDAADAVMLSAETAAGSYPVEAATIMNKIITETEANELYRKYSDASRLSPEQTPESAITVAARVTAETLPDAAAIVSYTLSGSTAGRVSRERPCLPIVCMTPDVAVARKMSLFWGIESVVCDKVDLLTDVAKQASAHCQRLYGAETGDKIILTAGLPFNVSGTTNLLHIFTVSGESVQNF
ncbi:MAG: pyruvate kinase [Alphaproteobacteria bacterium]|nr:pyruvate kinase [Alphaproteobacteria bacterium]